MTPAQFNELQRQADVIEQHEKWKKEQESINVILSNNESQLPKQEISDENITKQSWIYEPRDKFDAAFLREAFIRGAEWYREQLKSK